MKIQITTLCALSCAASLAPAALVHHYTLDGNTTGTAVDSVGGSNGVWNGDAGDDARVAGIIAGGVAVNDENGGNGQEHFRMNLTGLNGANALTVTGWVNIGADNNNSVYNAFFMSRDVGFDSTGDGAADLTGQNWGLAIRDNGAPHRLDSRMNGGGLETSPTLGTGQWYHLAMTWDGVSGSRNLYLDGTNVGSATAPIGSIVQGGEWRLSDDPALSNRELNAILDDVAVWNEVLTPTQIAQIESEGRNNGLNAVEALNVPEPSTAFLGLLGLGALGLRRRK